MPDIILQNVVLSYPHLYDPVQYKGKGAFRYSGQFIFPLTYDFTEVNAAVAEARRAAGLPDTCDSPLSIVQKGPLAGQWQCAAYGYDTPPQLVDQNRAPLVDRGQIFAGCIVHAGVDIYAHKNDGITAGLKAIMVVDNSVNVVRLDNRQDAAEMFAPVAGAPATTAAPAGAAPTGVPTQQAAPVAQQAAPVAQQQAPVAQPQGFAPPVAAPGAAPAPVAQPGQPAPGGYAPPQ